MVNGTTGSLLKEEEEDDEKSPASTSCKSGSQPTRFHVVQAATPPRFKVRCSSRTPWTAEGKAKSARAVKARSNVSEGNEREVESMIAVSTFTVGLVVVVVEVVVVVVVRAGEEVKEEEEEEESKVRL